MAKPHVVDPWRNFAGPGAAQSREYARDAADITVIGRKTCRDDIANVPLKIFEGRDPAVSVRLPCAQKALSKEMVLCNRGKTLNWGLNGPVDGRTPSYLNRGLTANAPDKEACHA